MDLLATGDLWESKLKEVVRVHVDYYDDAHQKALQSYSSISGIGTVVAAPLELPVHEFLTHYLFHRARTGSGRFSGYEQTRRMIISACSDLQWMLKLQNAVLALENDVQRLPREIAEHVGESIALSVVGRIHGLTEADWLPIEEGPKSRSFDFEYASNGSQVIQVEAKGRVVDDNSLKSSAISGAAGDIVDKKASLNRVQDQALRYGVITAISKMGQPLRAWLLDPAPDDPPKRPEDLRLLARLHFLRWIIWLVSPRSHLATALATRINAIRQQPDAYLLSGVPLLQADGKPFEFDRIFIAGESISAFFATRSRVVGGPAGGVVMRMAADDALLFVGMPEELIDLAAGQKFPEMVSYRGERAIVRKSVECVVPKAQFGKMNFDKDELPAFADRGAYVHFTLEGTLAYTHEGLIFGALPVPGKRGRTLST
jgi:hypothetical protein